MPYFLRGCDERVDKIKALVLNTDKSKNMDSSVAPQGGVAPYKHCLNCGAELMGGYCHQCGQHASDPVPRIGGFVAEYLNNAFIWDPLFFPTLWKLISRPGFLTREYMSGKFIAYEHPLKINMFFMFVFLSIFVIFTDVDELHNNYTKFVANEDVTAYIVASSLLDKEGYAERMTLSERDTVLVNIPLSVAEKYSLMITPIEAKYDSQDDAPYVYLASVPKVLIEDGYLIGDDVAGYAFPKETDGISEAAETEMIVRGVWGNIERLFSKYFPIIVLLTVPLLAMAVGIIHRKYKLPKVNFLIFALHYVAFLEFLMLVIYLLYVAFHPAMAVLEWMMIIISNIYLVVAVREVYGSKNWFRNVVKAFMINTVYMCIMLGLLLGIFIISCTIVALDAEMLTTIG